MPMNDTAPVPGLVAKCGAIFAAELKIGFLLHCSTIHAKTNTWLPTVVWRKTKRGW